MMVLMVESMIMTLVVSTISLYLPLTCFKGETIEMAKQKIKVTRSYLDAAFEQKSVTKETDFEPKTDLKVAFTDWKGSELKIVNLGIVALLTENLGKACEEDFPADAISEAGYSAIFDLMRPRLEAKGIEGIKDLRKAFLDLAKSNPKVRAQIIATGEAMKIEI